MPRGNRPKLRRLRRRADAPKPWQSDETTPEHAALRLVMTGKCSPAILEPRRSPLMLPGGRRPTDLRPTRGRSDA